MGDRGGEGRPRGDEGRSNRLDRICDEKGIEDGATAEDDDIKVEHLQSRDREQRGTKNAALASCRAR